MALRIQPNRFRLKLVAAVATFIVALQPIVGLMQTHLADAAPNTAYTSPSFGSLSWSTDRTAPSGGYTAASNLVMRVDGSAPNANQNFYKYEGIKAPLPSGVSSVKADLYVDPAWSGHDVIVGMWGQVEAAGTTASCGGDGCAWPILEFSNLNDGSHTATVDVFDTFTGGYKAITNVTYGGSLALEVSVNKLAGKISYFLNGTQIYTHSNTDASVAYDTLKQVIFNNRNAGSDYTVTWSNLQLGTFNPVPNLTYPANNSSINTNDFWFDWDDVDGAVSYETQFSQSNSTDGSGSLNSGVWAGDYQHNQPTASTLRSVGANGTWYWQVRTVFPGGVKSDWSPVSKMTIDMVAPAAPTNLKWKTSTNVTVTDGGITHVYDGTAQWGAVSDVDHYVYKYWNDIPGNPYKTGSEYTTNVGTTSLYGMFNQGDGVHHFCVAAVDAAGNASACTPFTITYDATAPLATITAPATGAFVKGVVTIEGTVADNNPMNSYFSIYKNGSGSPILTSLYSDGRTTHTLNWNTSGVSDGQYTIYFETRDKAGNKDGTISSLGNSVKKVTVTVDNTAPVVTITSAVRNSDGTTTVTGTTTDNTSPVIVSLDGDELSPVTPVGGSWTITTDPLSNVAHQFVAKSTDAAGNAGTSTPRTVAADAELTALVTNGVVPATTSAVPFFGPAPIITGATNTNGQDVLGTSTAPQNSTNANNDDEAVKGASDEKNTSAAQSGLFGLAWYWWLAILAAIVGLWWLIAARRRKHNEV